MEGRINLFNKSALDGHLFKVNWTFDHPVYTNVNNSFNETKCSPDCKHDHIYLSPGFSLSKYCQVKWQMIYQEIYNCDEFQRFKIGLQIIDTQECAVDGFCCVDISISNKKISENNYFEFHSLKKDKVCYCPRVKLFSKGADSVTQCFQRSQNCDQTGKKVQVTGIIISQKCCNTPAVGKELMCKNVSQLQKDFQSCFNEKCNADLTLKVGEESLQAHKFILCARSPVFQRLFSQDLVENNKNSVCVDDIDKAVMEAFLSYLYSGVVDSREFNVIFELYSVAEKYEVPTLIETCRHIFISLLSFQTVTPILKLAEMHSDEDLKKISIKYICENFSNVEETVEWKELLHTHPHLVTDTLKKVNENIYELP